MNYRKEKKVAEFYDELKYGIDTLEPELGRHLLSLVELNPENLRDKYILEAGVGRGNWTAQLCRLSKNYVGIDISFKSVEYIRKNITPRVKVASILDLPFDSGKFDFVFCIGVLHHTTDQIRGFKELLRVVKPGGYLYLFLYGSVFPRDVIRSLIFLGFHSGPQSVKKGLCKLFGKLSRFPIPEAVLFRSELEFVLWDWYFVPVQHHNTYYQVRRWFSNEGAKLNKIIPYPHRSSFSLHKRLGELAGFKRFFSPDFFLIGQKRKNYIQHQK
jgi:SAM-dependent methyltransferase